MPKYMWQNMYSKAALSAIKNQYIFNYYIGNSKPFKFLKLKLPNKNN